MTLGGQRPRSDNSDEIHAALAGCSEQTNGSQPPAHSKTRFGFKANDFVVYPAHGVGQIVTIEEQTVAGACLEFVVVNFAKDKMTLRVPTGKMANAGMRKLSDPAAIVQVRRTLSRAPYKARGNWSRAGARIRKQDEFRRHHRLSGSNTRSLSARGRSRSEL